MTARAAAPPAYGWAQAYDRLLGRAGFGHVWPAFLRAARRFRLAPDSVADLGCGTGLFLEAVADRWPAARLVGVDLSPAMLEAAGRRLAGRRATLVRGDIRHVRLSRPVSLVTCNFDTVNYLTRQDDIQEMVNRLRENLCHGGHLIFDLICWTAGPIMPALVQDIRLPTFRGKWLIAPFPDNQGSRVVMLNRQWTGTGWHAWRESHVQRWWPIGTITRHLRAAGLGPLAVTPVVPGARGTPAARWVQVVALRE